MKAQYRDDSAKGAGNGLLIFSQAVLPDGPWAVSIQRSSDMKFLTGKSRGNWVGENYFIPMRGDAGNNGSLVFSLPPEIVDSLDIREQYRVSLKGSEGDPMKCRLDLDGITYSLSENVDNTARRASQAASVAAKPETPQPARERGASENVDDRPLDMTPPKDDAPQRDTAGAPPRRRSCLTGLVIFILALLCLAWWYFDKRNETAPPVAEAPASQPKPQATPQQPAARASVEEQVRQFFMGKDQTSAAALELAIRLPKQDKADQDAVYRLYYFATNHNNPAALLEYGACLDPSLPQWGTIQKNAVDAWQAYRGAQKKNPDKARDAMNHLRAWLEKQAAAGDVQAKKWLEETAR